MTGFASKLFLAFAFLTLLSCGSKSGNQPNNSPASPDNPPAESLYADGWEELTIFTNGLKTVVDAFGHFRTERNACGKEEEGAIPPDRWNELVALLNALTVARSADEDSCQPEQHSNLPPRIQGEIQIQLLSGQKRTLLEPKGSDICGKIADKAVAAHLIEVIGNIIIQADLEGCPEMASKWRG